MAPASAAPPSTGLTVDGDVNHALGMSLVDVGKLPADKLTGPRHVLNLATLSVHVVPKR